MNRIISFVLVIIILLSSPTFTNAVSLSCDTDTPLSIDITSMSKAELDTLAIQTFPEFASAIRGDNISRSTVFELASNSDDSSIIYSETRSIADDTLLILQQMSDGIVRMIFASRTVINEHHSGSAYNYSCVDIQVTSNVSDQTLIIKDFKYTLISGAYDQIDDFGIILATASMASPVVQKPREDASGPATYTIVTIFELSYPYNTFCPTYAITLEITVGAGQAIIDLY